MRATESAETACITDHRGKLDTLMDGTAIISRQMRMDAAPSTMTEKNVRTLKVKDN